MRLNGKGIGCIQVDPETLFTRLGVKPESLAKLNPYASERFEKWYEGMRTGETKKGGLRLAFITGEPRTGKSWFASDLAMSLMKALTPVYLVEDPIRFEPELAPLEERPPLTLLDYEALSRRPDSAPPSLEKLSGKLSALAPRGVSEDQHGVLMLCIRKFEWHRLAQGYYDEAHPGSELAGWEGRLFHVSTGKNTHDETRLQVETFLRSLSTVAHPSATVLADPQTCQAVHEATDGFPGAIGFLLEGPLRKGIEAWVNVDVVDRAPFLVPMEGVHEGLRTFETQLLDDVRAYYLQGATEGRTPAIIGLLGFLTSPASVPVGLVRTLPSLSPFDRSLPETTRSLLARCTSRSSLPLFEPSFDATISPWNRLVLEAIRGLALVRSGDMESPGREGAESLPSYSDTFRRSLEVTLEALNGKLVLGQPLEADEMEGLLSFYADMVVHHRHKQVVHLDHAFPELISFLRTYTLAGRKLPGECDRLMETMMSFLQQVERRAPVFWPQIFELVSQAGSEKLQLSLWKDLRMWFRVANEDFTGRVMQLQDQFLSFLRSPDSEFSRDAWDILPELLKGGYLSKESVHPYLSTLDPTTLLPRLSDSDRSYYVGVGWELLITAIQEHPSAPSEKTVLQRGILELMEHPVPSVRASAWAQTPKLVELGLLDTGAIRRLFPKFVELMGKDRGFLGGDAQKVWPFLISQGILGQTERDLLVGLLASPSESLRMAAWRELANCEGMLDWIGAGGKEVPVRSFSDLLSSRDDTVAASAWGLASKLVADSWCDWIDLKAPRLDFLQALGKGLEGMSEWDLLQKMISHGLFEESDHQAIEMLFERYEKPLSSVVWDDIFPLFVERGLLKARDNGRVTQSLLSVLQSSSAWTRGKAWSHVLLYKEKGVLSVTEIRGVSQHFLDLLSMDDKEDGVLDFVEMSSWEIVPDLVTSNIVSVEDVQHHIDGLRKKIARGAYPYTVMNLVPRLLELGILGPRDGDIVLGLLVGRQDMQRAEAWNDYLSRILAIPGVRPEGVRARLGAYFELLNGKDLSQVQMAWRAIYPLTEMGILEESDRPRLLDLLTVASPAARMGAWSDGVPALLGTGLVSVEEVRERRESFHELLEEGSLALRMEAWLRAVDLQILGIIGIEDLKARREGFVGLLKGADPFASAAVWSRVGWAVGSQLVGWSDLEPCKHSLLDLLNAKDGVGRRWAWGGVPRLIERGFLTLDDVRGVRSGFLSTLHRNIASNEEEQWKLGIRLLGMKVVSLDELRGHLQELLGEMDRRQFTQKIWSMVPELIQLGLLPVSEVQKRKKQFLDFLSPMGEWKEFTPWEALDGLVAAGALGSDDIVGLASQFQSSLTSAVENMRLGGWSSASMAVRHHVIDREMVKRSESYFLPLLSSDNPEVSREAWRVSPSLAREGLLAVFGSADFLDVLDRALALTPDADLRHHAWKAAVELEHMRVISEDRLGARSEGLLSLLTINDLSYRLDAWCAAAQLRGAPGFPKDALRERSNALSLVLTSSFRETEDRARAWTAAARLFEAGMVTPEVLSRGRFGYYGALREPVDPETEDPWGSLLALTEAGIVPDADKPILHHLWKRWEGQWRLPGEEQERLREQGFLPARVDAT